jgi:putative membrane protein
MNVMAGVLAQMMDRGDMGGDGRGWWWLVGLAVMIGLLVPIIVVAKRTSRSGHGDAPETSRRSSAEEVLAERFARGEIEADEFRHRRDLLRS